jgi:hypothetical protein
MHALGISLLVGGAAFLCGALVFLLPTERKLSSRQKSVEESQEDIDFYLEQIINSKKVPERLVGLAI